MKDRELEEKARRAQRAEERYHAILPGGESEIAPDVGLFGALAADVRELLVYCSELRQRLKRRGAEEAVESEDKLLADMKRDEVIAKIGGLLRRTGVLEAEALVSKLERWTISDKEADAFHAALDRVEQEPIVNLPVAWVRVSLNQHNLDREIRMIDLVEDRSRSVPGSRRVWLQRYLVDGK